MLESLMGSKMPPKKPVQNNEREDSAASVGLSSGETRNRLLGRIAGALQVPQAMLYDPHSPTPSEGGDAGGTDLDGECLALLQAFRRIRDPEERRRLLMLVQEAGGQA